MAHILRYLALLGSSAVLLGCSHTFTNKNVKDDFDCPAQEGFGCASIETIRSMIVTSGTPQPAAFNVDERGVQTNVSGVPKWAPDIVLKVHIGEYVDDHGNYHDDSVIYVVAQDGGWEPKRD